MSIMNKTNAWPGGRRTWTGPMRISSDPNTAARLTLVLVLLGLSAGCSLAFTQLAIAMRQGTLAAFDLRIIELVQGTIRPERTTFMTAVTHLGSRMVQASMLAIAACWLLRRKLRNDTIFLVAAYAGGTMLNRTLKWAFHRDRPDIHRLVEESGYSFPSGHSMESIVLFGAFAVIACMQLRSRRLRVGLAAGLFALTLIIGCSRIYLGVHYPSDVIAGYAAGGAWLLLCLAGLLGSSSRKDHSDA